MNAITTRVGRACVLLSLGLLAVSIAGMATLPPLGTDSLIYHLTLPASGFRDDLPFHDSAAEHSPFLGEALWAALMRATGDDSLVWIVPLAFFVLTLRFLYLAARFSGAGRPVALAVTAHAAAFAPFVASSHIANTDLLVAAGASWALLGLARARWQPRAGLVSLAGGIALMAASKYVGLVYAVAALAAAGVLRKRWLSRSGRWPRLEMAGAVVAAIFVLLFVARNVLRHGNPVYPQTFLWMPGLYDSSPLRVGFADIGRALRLLVDGEGAFHPAVSAFLWIGALLGAASRRAAPVSLFILASILLYFLIVPFWTEARLLFPVFLALHLAAAAGLAGHARRRPGGRESLAGALAVLLLVRFAAIDALAAPSFWVVLLVAAAASFRAWPPRFFAKRLLPTAGIAALLAALTAPLWLPPLRTVRAENRKAAYDLIYGPQGRAWLVVDSASRDRRMTVAYTGTAVVYPLFGPRLRNRVIYVRTSWNDRPTPIDFREDDTRLYLLLSRARRNGFDEHYWLAQLQYEQTDLLYIARDDSRADPPPELDAARRNPDRFQLLFSQNDVHVFRLR